MKLRRRNVVSFVIVVGAFVAVAALAGVSSKQSAAPKNDTGVLFAVDAASSGPDATSTAADGRIINGTKAAPALDATSKWRSISMLLIFDGSSAGLCGSSFVSSRALVTAAHCVTEAGVEVPPTSLWVTNGTTDISAVLTALKAGTQPAQITQLTPVTKVHRHASYNEKTSAYDVAVLEVAADAAFPPVPLAGATEPGTWGGGVGRSIESGGASIAGWGDTDYSTAAAYSTALMEATIPIHSDASCASSWGSEYDKAIMLCAGTLDTDPSLTTSNGVDTCQGDSGGPLLAPAADGTPRLVGITSFGATCASAYFPGVYTRIDSVRAWIETITGPASGTTDFPATGSVLGGGGSDVAITSPLSAQVGARGATKIKWELADGAVVKEVHLRNTPAGTYWKRANSSSRAVAGFDLGHGNVRAGTSKFCVITASDASSCIPIAKKGAAASTVKTSAGVVSARFRNGRITLRGRIASTQKNVQVRVVVKSGSSRHKSKPIRLRMKKYPRYSSFSTSFRWKGRVPNTLKVDTQVKLGGKWRSFRSTLR